MATSETQPRINFQCLDAVRISLNIEKQGLDFYTKAAKEAKNHDVRNLFARLAQEEEEHIRILNLKEKHLMPVVKGKSDFFRQDLKQFISNDLNGKIFPVRKGESVEIPMIENDFEALEFGIECEKRSINLLSRLLKQERKIDVRTIFSHLVAEEKKHLTALQELQEKLPNRAA